MPMPDMWDRKSNLLLLTNFDLKTRYLNPFTETHMHTFISKEGEIWPPT